MPSDVKKHCSYKGEVKRRVENVIDIMLPLTKGSVFDVQFLGTIRLILSLLKAMHAAWFGLARLGTVDHALLTTYVYGQSL